MTYNVILNNFLYFDSLRIWHDLFEFQKLMLYFKGFEGLLFKDTIYEIGNESESDNTKIARLYGTSRFAASLYLSHYRELEWFPNIYLS